MTMRALRGRLYSAVGELDYVVALSRLGVERVLQRYLVEIDGEDCWDLV